MVLPTATARRVALGEAAQPKSINDLKQICCEIFQLPIHAAVSQFLREL